MMKSKSKLLIPEIIRFIRKIYKTAFEISGKSILDQAVARGAFIDQSQSMNIFMSVPDNKRLTKSHFYAWKNGLKTGMYYLRLKPAVDPINFGLDPNVIAEIESKRESLGIIRNNNSNGNGHSTYYSNVSLCTSCQ